jgi:hypothetical protein
VVTMGDWTVSLSLVHRLLEQILVGCLQTLRYSFASVFSLLPCAASELVRRPWWLMDGCPLLVFRLFS